MQDIAVGALLDSQPQLSLDLYSIVRRELPSHASLCVVGPGGGLG